MPGSNLGSTTNPEVHTAVTPSLAVHNPGQHTLPLSAGIPATAAKGAAGQTISVHGTVAGLIVDIQVTK